MQVKKQQLDMDMEQQIGSKSGKEYIKAGLEPSRPKMVRDLTSHNLRPYYTPFVIH